MAYTVTLSMSGLAASDVPAAALTAKAILEQRLGGPHGVEAAYRAAHAVIGPDARLPTPDECSPDERSAVDRWRRSIDAVWDQLHAQFEHLPQDERDERIGEAALWIEIEGTELAPF